MDVAGQWSALGIAIQTAIFPFPEACAALLRGEIDTALFPIDQTPVALPEGLAITAVSARQDPAERLFIRRDRVDETQLFDLTEQALVCAQGGGRQVQLRDFRPDLRFAGPIDNPVVIPEALHAGEWDAAIVAAAEVDAEMEEAFHTVRLHPREFMPAPGQGAMAWITCKDDLHIRRVLKAVHHPDVSALTNIERGVLRLLGGNPELPLGVHAEYDGLGAWHVWAAYAETPDAPLRRARLSSSTRFQLAEKVADELRI